MKARCVIPHKAIELSPEITFSECFVTLAPSFSHDMTKLVKCNMKDSMKAGVCWAHVKQAGERFRSGYIGFAPQFRTKVARARI